MSPIHALLGLLTQGDRYGYELKKSIDQEYGPFWKIDYAQLYRSLGRIVRAGWARVRTSKGGRGPRRKVYSLTELGRRALIEWLAEPADDQDELVVKLRLSALTGTAVSAMLAVARGRLEKERQHLNRAVLEARGSGDASGLFGSHAALGQVDAGLVALDLFSAVTAPASRRAPSPELAVLITGSDDPLLARLARESHAISQVVGSLDGLLALARHEADLAGAHLLDLDTGQYNIPFVRHLLPEDDLLLVNLAFRENGLLLSPGNPKNVRGVQDLSRPKVRLINRQRGTGTRLLLGARLRTAGIEPHTIGGWERAASSHSGVAAAICAGTADVGPGLKAVAAAWGLDFIPLGRERFDLVIPRDVYESKRLRLLLESLHADEFHKSGSELPGYDLSESGHIVAHIH